MTLPTLATVDDLERLLGESVGVEGTPEYEQALALLEQASEIVRAYAGRSWLNADGTELDGVPGAIPGVVVGMAFRAVQNPAGVTQDTTGPFSVSYGAAAAQRLYLTKPEKAVIRAATGRTGIGVIATTRGPLETPHVLDGDDPWPAW